MLERAVMPDGTGIQINDWSENYSCDAYGSELAAYAISKNTCKGPFAPKVNEKWRFGFIFNSHEECKEAFEKLKTGEAVLKDYAEFLRANPTHKDTIESYRACL